MQEMTLNAQVEAVFNHPSITIEYSGPKPCGDAGDHVHYRRFEKVYPEE